jgi:GT2 family glycosyltransferase
MIELGILICNFNKCTYLQACLNSVYASDYDGMSFEVIVVDNASNDGSPEMIRQHYPKVTLLENATNLGGAGGFDRGIRYCIEKGYPYVALLDNDVRLEKDTLSNLIRYIDAHPDVGVAGAKICSMDHPDTLQELGSFIDWEKTFNVVTPLKGYRDSDTLPEAVSCDYVPACCLVTTSAVLRKVGSFNTDHFIYWDDMDWCTRIKRAGYEIHAVKASRVFHKMGASNHPTTFGSYYFERNRIMFFLKYLDEDRLDAYLDSVCQWLLSSTFFSNLKKSCASAVSFMMGLDDLLMNHLGARPESILERLPAAPFHAQHGMRKEARVALRMVDSMEVNRRIHLELQGFFIHPVDLVCKAGSEDSLRTNFPEPRIMTDTDLDAGAYDHVFYALNHLLDYTEDMPCPDNGFFVDRFINMASAKEIANVVSSYMIYKDIFTNVHRPVMARRFRQIRARLQSSSSD